MKQKCPSCHEYEVVTAIHPETEIIEEYPNGQSMIIRIPEEHQYCHNCDWNTCGFD